MAFYGNNFTITLKGDASPLTSADTASHEFLLASLKSLLPGVPIISEESDGAMTRGTDTDGRFWLVDPLDGTKEFVKGTDEFTVNIALIEEGHPVLGVVHAPALGRTYWGSRNSGAWCQTPGQLPIRIAARRAESKSLSVVASKDHAGPLVETMLARLKGASRLSMGSSLKFCLVAEGKADIYLRDLPTMEWDTAAAQCIVETAGGNVCTLDGKPLRYGKPGLKNPSLMTVGDPTFRWTTLVR